MTVEIYKLCAVALLCCFLCFVIKGVSPLFTALLSLTGLVLIFGAVIPDIKMISDFAAGYLEHDSVSEGFKLVLKGCAVMLITEITADLCTRADEPLLAKALTAAGKTEIVIIALPLLKTVIETALSLCN